MSVRDLQLTKTERRLYLVALLHMASVDEEITKEEIAFIKERCGELEETLTTVHVRRGNLLKIRDGIKRKEVRQTLLEDLVSLAGADFWTADELDLVRTLAESWHLPKPERWPDRHPWKGGGLTGTALRDLSNRRQARTLKRPDLIEVVDEPSVLFAVVLGLLLAAPGIALLGLAVGAPELIRGLPRNTEFSVSALYFCLGAPFVLIGISMVWGALQELARRSAAR